MPAKPTNGKVQMPKKEFVAEHKHLPKVLRKGSKAERAEEAAEQSGELKDVNEASEKEPDDMMAQIQKKFGGRHA